MQNSSRTLIEIIIHSREYEYNLEERKERKKKMIINLARFVERTTEWAATL